MIFTKPLKRKVECQKQIESLQERLALATSCLEKISNGSFDIKVDEGKNEHDDESKKFVALLTRMSNTLQAYSESEQQRIWVAEGVSKFMDLFRGDNNKKSDFYDKIISLLVRYTGANQGGLFTLNDQDPADRFLEMTACYAYGKKRFQDKKIAIGHGMLGQCFLEKETIRLNKIPGSYITITSGLGEATPRFLLLVPMKHNDEVLGIIELASFQSLKPYQIEFVERIAENMASATLTIRNSLRLDQLFAESQLKAAMLQQQEETLRQNVEQLIRTQEEMERNQKKLDQQTALLKFILDNIPFPVFVKDEKGRYALVNKAEAKLFNLTDQELIGKDDSYFVARDEEWKVIQESDAKVMSSDVAVELPLQHFTTTQGYAYVFKTTKIPFVNNVTGKKNILGVSIDMTEKLDLEKKLFNEKMISGNNTLINITGRQRMLSQKIGFYAEVILRGKEKNASLLHDAIELYEHSLQIIRYGGMPMGVICESPLPKSQDELLPYLEKIESAWDPYKKAAENILYFNKFENKASHQKLSEIESSIDYLEENSELLLNLNNELILAYLDLNYSDLNKSQLTTAY